MRRTLALAVLLLAAACASKHTTFTGQLKLGKTADENYQAGLEEMKAENYSDAVKFFEYVKTKYPFDKAAALADLRLADIKFTQDRWSEAAEAYKQFVQLHPAHPDVDYAEYRVGLSYFKDSPRDFALFPPSYEKDQRQTEKAVQALDDFVKTQEGKDAGEQSKYLPEARKVLAEARGRLAAREWYVAEFYFKRKKWAGAAGRYEALVSRYPGSEHEVDALFKLAQSYLALQEKTRARTALQKLVVEHPQDPRRAQAEQLLGSLR